METRQPHPARASAKNEQPFRRREFAARGAAVAAPAVVLAGGPGTLPVNVGASLLVALIVGLGARGLVREAIGLCLRLLLRVRSEGTRFEGPAVVVANHPSVLDGPAAMLADRRLRPIAKWQAGRAARAAIWASDAVVTSGPDPRPALAPAIDHLEGGGRIWLAPEGGLTPGDGTRLGACRTGAARMAQAADVPVQVTALRWEDGARGPALRCLWRGRRRVTVVWGPVLEPTTDVEADTARLGRAMAAIAGLHPPRPEVGRSTPALPPRTSPA